MFVLLDSTKTGITFSNDIYNTDKFNIFNYRNFYNGGGVAAGDINNDGLTDLLFTANMGSNKLYLNKGNMVFEDITEKAGIGELEKWSTGVVMVDINADNLLDIYICNAGYRKGISSENALFINNGDLTFTEKAAEYGLNENGYTTHTAFFDYDKDGDLDAYILNNSFIPVNTLNYANNRELRAKDWPVKDFMKGGGDKLLKNDNGQFVDVSEAAGIYGSLIGFGLGITVGDVNNDNWPDMYVSNDFFEKDYLYINQKDGTFKEDLENRIGHTSMASMGADMADLNQDGKPEIFVTDMLPGNEERLKTTASYESHYIQALKRERGFYNQYMQNSLQLNDGDGYFSEIGQFSGVAKSDWSWGALLFDADNDGLNDIYVSNGIRHDVIDQDFIDFFTNELNQKMALSGQKESIEKILEKMPSKPIVNNFFKNKGDLKFEDSSYDFGFREESFSNGAMYVDLDNDGDLDLVVNNINQESFVYENQSDKKNHYLKLKLKGEGQNTFAIGSEVAVYAKGKNYSSQLIPSRGFQSSSDYTLTLGLGKNFEIDSITINWPNDNKTVLGNTPVDTTISIDIAASKNVILKKTNQSSNQYFDIVDNPFDKHQENDYLDYYSEKNIPFNLSAEGPKAVYGDINNDGKQDLIICGASGQATQIYTSSKKGYQKVKQPDFERFARFEDTTLELFDADNDGDLDLYIGSGGNEYKARSKELMDRLFLNDGNGNFKINGSALPLTSLNTAVVKAEDIDGDGFLDLFVGTRNTPQEYGKSTPSFILKNNGKGEFSVSSEISGLGLVNDALWTDIDLDGKNELVIVGDWMTPKIFKNKKGLIEEWKSTGLEKLSGFWSACKAVDIDNDGDQDLILGNLGENFSLEISPNKPLKLWVADLDKNGTLDKVISKTIDGKDSPVFLKRDLTEQFPALKNTSLKHSEYAKKSVQDLFDMIENEEVEPMLFNFNKSIVAINDGKGYFSIKELPTEVQFSCVNDIGIIDIDKDGFQDIIVGGNSSQMIPQFGTLDACRGKILKNIGGDTFKYISDLKLSGQVRQILPLENRNMLILRNNETPKMYHFK
ncbi:VCBS repeat-containing protein [uncultured Arcticibacterium sp.]|uniref:VCBS repeat-containing protein n=1 Tax=uncultured Arcticibacterium sp. TaxID=2173042 RepID=UPI0030FB1376